MGNTYYTSDLHLGHRLVAGLRGHQTPIHIDGIDTWSPDTEAHDAWLAELWDSTVRPADQVFVLGDIAMNAKPEILNWIAERPGTKHLIAGNHDAVHPAHRSALRALPKWAPYFATIQPFLRRRVADLEFLLSHFPYASFGDGEGREGSRFDQYRLPDLGMPLLHGHTHGPERAHGTMLHVGIDAWKSLVSQAQVIEWLDALPREERSA